MQNDFFDRMKNDKGARAIAVTILLMLLVLTAIIVTTVIANRAPKETPLSELEGSELAGVSDPEEDKKEENKKEDSAETDVLPSHFLLPVSGVLLHGHENEVQVFSPTMQDYRMHTGIDIGTVMGASVSAMADGVIAQVWEDPGMGQCVSIKHGGDCYTVYKNLSTTLPAGVVVGAAVKKGDVIGTVGESAMAEITQEPHLHLDMLVGGEYVDPTDYFDEDAMATLREDTNYEDAS